MSATGQRLGQPALPTEGLQVEPEAPGHPDLQAQAGISGIALVERGGHGSGRSGVKNGARARRSRLKPSVALAGAFLFVLVVCALGPSLLAPHDPIAIPAVPNPFLRPFHSFHHILGTDDDGRDVLSRMIYGARPSLEMGLGATGIGVGGGTVLGLVAGLVGGLAESLVMRVVDVILSIPDLLLALVVIAILGAGTLDALLAVGIAAIPAYARMVRAQTHIVRGATYVEAAGAMGVGRLRVIGRHVLPNALKPVLVLATLGIGTAIGYGASLSFLGLGTKPPAAEWGSMLAEGLQFINNDWLMMFVPGIAITLTVLCVTVVGRDLKRRSEGR